MGSPTAESTVDPSEDIEGLISAVGRKIDEGRLPARVFNDAALHQLELERVFGNTWLFVGHVSEVADAGDYVKRHLGNDPYILVRDERGDVNVFLDSCRHRGTEICRAEQGNTSHFRCPYHGWTYDNSGDLVGVPKKEEAYARLKPDEYSLHRAPRVETYHGFVFASLEPDIEPLETYLGDLTWYLDLYANITDGGMELVGEPWRYVLDVNWKISPENSAGDSYHTHITHKSAVDVGFVNTDWSWAGERYNVYISDIRSGADEIDGLTMLVGQIEIEDDFALFGYDDEIKEHFPSDALSEDQIEVAKRSTINVTTVFPNLTLLHEVSTPSPDEPTSGWQIFRKARPLAPGKTEIISGVLAPQEASTAYKRRIYRAGMAAFGPAGNLGQDDNAVWEGITDVGGTMTARKHDLELSYEMGLDHVSDEVKEDETWPGPGFASRDLNERYARNYYRSWYNYMAGED